MKKFLTILAFFLLFCNVTKAVDSDKPLTEKDLEGLEPSESRLEAIIEHFKKSIENKVPIDPEAAALQFGYKDFEDFAKQYLKLFKLTDISVDEIKEFLEGTDETVIIDQSQENLDKLYSLIMNDKYFRKKNTYFKVYKKGKHQGYKIKFMSLAVYINYEKEMTKITKNPNLKKISPFTWNWGWSSENNSAITDSYAINGCKKEVKKYKLFGGKCIIVDQRSKTTGEIKNTIKPSQRVVERNEKLKKQKLKPKKEKKKTIAKVEEKVTEPEKTIDLIIPVQVYIIDVNKPGYKTTTTANEVINDFKIANNIWNTQGIQFEPIEIIVVKGNGKSIIKDLKWVKEKYVTSLKIDRKKGELKSKNKKKYRRLLHKLIKGSSNRNSKAINLFYVPKMPASFMCGIAYSYSRSTDSRADKYKRQNAGYTIVGEQVLPACGPTGEVVAHELGHMFSLGHKGETNKDLMMWGNGKRVNKWEADEIRKYHKRYLRKTLSMN